MAVFSRAVFVAASFAAFCACSGDDVESKKEKSVFRSPFEMPERFHHLANGTVSARALKPWEDDEAVEKLNNGGLACKLDNQCGNGKCANLAGILKVGHCVCSDGYYSLKASEPCKEEKKSRTTAILLHVFLGGVGAGAWYLGWNLFGALSLAFCCAPCCCTCLAGLVNKNAEDGQEKTKKAGQCFNLIGQCGQCAVWITLIVWMANDSAKDSNNVPIERLL